VLFVKLDANYAEDAAVAALGRDARLLFVDSICWAKRTGSCDGRVTRAVLRRLAWDSTTPCGVLADELVQAGVWTEDDDGWTIRSYTKWQQTPDDVEEAKAKRSAHASAAARARWGNAPDDAPECPSMMPDDARASCSDMLTHDARHAIEQSRAEQSRASITLLSESDAPSAKPRSERVIVSDAEWNAWWSAYPRKDAKAKARERYTQARKAGVSAESLLGALQAQAKAWRIEGKETRFMPMAATWLHQRRFEDELGEEPKSAPKAKGRADGMEPCPLGCGELFLSMQEATDHAVQCWEARQ
jgi:hypothetical protein